LTATNYVAQAARVRHPGVDGAALVAAHLIGGVDLARHRRGHPRGDRLPGRRLNDAASVPLFAVYDPAPAAIATLDGSNLTVTLDLGLSG
jgi:hypothetical protein